MVEETLKRYADDITLQELVRLRVENGRLREALRHYASEENWLNLLGDDYQRVWLEPNSSTRDRYHGFSIARSALKGDE